MQPETLVSDRVFGEVERVAFRFERYRQLTSLLPEEGPKKKTGRRK